MQTMHTIFQESIGLSISDKVSYTLRVSIINSILKQGERLVESNLAREMSVSITPVRHALAQMEKEGLVTIFPYKGTYVTKLDKKFVHEASCVRTVLELQAAREAFDKFTEDDIQKMMELINKISNNPDQNFSLYQISQGDIMFHNIVFERSGIDLLKEMWTLIKPRVQLITSCNKSTRPGELRKVRHMKLIEAIKSGNKQHFLRELKAHCEMLEHDFSISY